MLKNNQLQKLYQYAFTLCQSESDAYDFLYSAIEKCLQSQSDIKNTEAYVRTSIKHLWIDSIKTNRESIEFDETHTYDLNEKPLEQVFIEQDQLNRIWQTLTASERELLYYWAVLDYSTAEIAAETSTPRGTILSKLYRLRKRLEQHSNGGRAEHA